MGLALDDFEDTVAVQANAKKLEQEAKQQETVVAQTAQTGVAPPSDVASAAVSTTNTVPKQTQPNLINQAWNAVKPAFNPLHYEEGKPQDYTNLDVPTTVAHGLALGATGLGLTSRAKRLISGENAQYAEQNKLAREKFEYQKQQDELARKAQLQANVTQAPVVQQSVAPPKPAPDLYGRIEPTFTAGPVAPTVAPPVTTQPNLPVGIDPNAPVGPRPSQADMNLVAQSNANKADKQIVAELQASGAPKPTNAPVNVATVNQTGPAVGTPQQVVEASKTAPTVVKPVAPPKSVIDTGGLTKEEAGMKKYLTSFYGGGTEGEKAYGKTIEILGKTPAYEQGKGGGLSAKDNETIKAWRKQNIEGPKVNLTYDMKKVMKGAGGLAILTAIPGFAEAAQRKDYAKMTDLASDFFVLPFAQSSEAGMPKKQEESIIAQKFKEAQKLGSPYRSVPPPR